MILLAWVLRTSSLLYLYAAISGHGFIFLTSLISQEYVSLTALVRHMISVIPAADVFVRSCGAWGMSLLAWSNWQRRNRGALKFCGI